MVGLSVILENYRDLDANKVISKGSMIKSPSPTSPPSFNVFSRRKSTNLSSTSCGFLDCCFLCKQKLMPGKDIYMYKGDRAFCSVECRCRQIFMDEEEATSAAKSGCTREYNCSLAATSSPSSSSRSGKGTRNRANNNAFAY